MASQPRYGGRNRSHGVCETKVRPFVSPPDRDGKSVETVFARELLDVVSAHSEYLATAIPGFAAALRWPQ
jgi:hypothetical protein